MSDDSNSGGGKPNTKFLHYIPKILMFLAIIAILASVFIGTTLFANTGASEVVYYHGAEVVEEVGVDTGVISYWEKLKNLISNPETAFVDYGFESTVEEYEYQEGLGVKVQEFEQISTPFEGELLEISGTILAQGIEDNLELKAYCTMDKPSGNLPPEFPIPAQLAGTNTNGNEARFYKDAQEVIEANCIYPNSLNIEQAINSAQANLRVYFEFVTKASHKTYFLYGSELSGLQSQKLDPFEYYGAMDPQLNSDNTITSKTTAGPINLGIGTHASQPFREKQPYHFTVSIYPGSIGLGGNLEYLDTLEVKMPPFVYLASDQEYLQIANYGASSSASLQLDSQTCDFINTAQFDEDGFKIYRLKTELLKQINTDCSPMAIKNSGMDEAKCVDLFKKEINARCRFVVKELPQAGMVYDFFRAEARYTYQIKKPATIQVNKLPSSSLSKPQESNILGYGL